MDKLSRVDVDLAKTYFSGTVLIGMEACTGAHHWARELQAKGFTVKPIAPQFVKPYVKSGKNDANDAEAVCEAMSRPSMRFAAVNTVEQQDIQAAHRIRSKLIGQRRSKAYQIRWLLNGQWDDLNRLGPAYSGTRPLDNLNGSERPGRKAAQQLRGVGPLIATTLVAAVGNDGKQVEPAPAEPENEQVREVR